MNSGNSSTSSFLLGGYQVPWSENIPKSWKACFLSRYYQVQLGKMLQPESEGPLDERKPYLRAANILWGICDLSDVKEMWFSPMDLRKLRLHGGDLLVSEGGDVGRSAIWQDVKDPVF